MGEDRVDDTGAGSEDTTRAREAVRKVEENRDALAEFARQVEASAPDTAARPVEGYTVEGAGGEDTTQAEENLRRVKENTEALREQARKIDASVSEG